MYLSCTVPSPWVRAVLVNVMGHHFHVMSYYMAKRDFANVINIFSWLTELIKSKITLGVPDLIQWTLQRSQKFKARDTLLVALKEQTTMLWRAPCGREWQAASRRCEWPLQQSRDLSPTTAGNWILPTMSLKENPDQSVVLVNILMSALWFQPEQRIQLPHDHTSNLQKLEGNKWC